MKFERTDQGLSNTALFYRVDVIVFVEGKKQESEGDAGSIDLLYWKKLFENFASQSTAQILCRGSKTDLLQIADKIKSGEITNVVVALDRDYDFESATNQDQPEVIYTYGYSWENDVWTLDNILHLLKNYALLTPIPDEDIKAISESHQRFLEQAKRVAVANLAARLSIEVLVMSSNEQMGLVKLR